jgi:hypothetical protein
VIILFLVFYADIRRKTWWIELEEVERKLKKYREKRGTNLEVEEQREFEKRHGDYAGVYYPNENKIYIPRYFPNPIEGYESKELKILKERFPEEYRELKNILLKIIKDPEIPKKEAYELWKRTYEIKTSILEKLKNSYYYRIKKLFSSIFYNMFKKSIGVGKYEGILQETEKFVGESYKFQPSLFFHIWVEGHETAHAILHNLIKELYGGKYIYSIIPESLDEGFADAFTVYHSLDRIERGYITPLFLYQLASRIESKIKDRNPKYLKYAIGDLIFGLDEIRTEMFKLHFSDLSMEELKKEVSHLRRKLGSKIDYIIGIIKNPNIPPEKKKEIFSKLEEKAIMKLNEIL